MTTHTSAAPIAPTDRVSDVLARDASLVEIFARHAPHFAKLRNRTLRRVMARLVTVEQAARTAGIPADDLLRELNAALGIATDDRASGAAPAGATAAPGQSATEPSVHPADAPVVELDVREELRAGREPFSTIMTAVAALNDGEVLRLRTTFEPVPLFTVLGKRGFAHEAVAHGADDWSVWFWKPRLTALGARRSAGAHAEGSPSGAAAERRAPSAENSSYDLGPNEILLDVRWLEPPEPLMRTMAALETLPEGHTLVQLNVRVPQLLLPMLAERGYACEVDESHADRVLVRIWRHA